MSLQVQSGTLEALDAPHTISNPLVVESSVIFSGTQPLIFSAATGNAVALAYTSPGTKTPSREIGLASQARVTINNLNGGNAILWLSGTGTLVLSGRSQFGTVNTTANIVFPSGAVCSLNSGTFTGAVGGAGSLVQSGNLPLNFSNAANNLSGTLSISSGTVTAASIGTAQVTVSSGELAITTSTTLGAINIVGGSMALNFNGNTSVASLIVGGVTYAPGTYTVAQLNSYQGQSLSIFSNGTGFTGALRVGTSEPGTVTLTNLSLTYNGSAQSATVTTNPPGLAVNITYNGSTTPPTQPGTYAVVASINDPVYVGSASGTLIISKAIPSLSIYNLQATANGNPQTVVVETAPANLPFTITYDGSDTPPTAPGSYAIVVTIDTADYQASRTGTLVISPPSTAIAARVSLMSLSQTYNGSPKPISFNTSPSGLNVSVTYNGSSTPPTDAGSYKVVATVDQTYYAGSTTGTLVISKQIASVGLSDLSVMYNGSAHLAAVSTRPSNLNVVVTYNGKATAPTDVGTYAVSARVSDPNYTGFAVGTLVITKGLAGIT
jgi:hypothetical protein